jgi:hypothetical protein
MSARYLEVTFRDGRAIAAYLYLPRCPGEKSHRTSRAEPGLVVDYNRAGTAIGIEITAPAKVTAVGVNRVLRALGFPPIKRKDLEPLRAA